MTERVGRWGGVLPIECELCHRPLLRQDLSVWRRVPPSHRVTPGGIETEEFDEPTFVDGRTQLGPWAIMCNECFSHPERGVGTLGVGRGQLYGLWTGLLYAGSPASVDFGVDAKKKGD